MSCVDCLYHIESYPCNNCLKIYKDMLFMALKEFEIYALLDNSREWNKLEEMGEDSQKIYTGFSRRSRDLVKEIKKVLK